MDRESSLRAEETRRLAHFESRSREAADDIFRNRHRVDVEILEARYDLALSLFYYFFMFVMVIYVFFILS